MIIGSKDPTINLLRSLQNSQIDDDLFSPSETKQFPEYLDDHDYGVQHGQNREFKSCARKSYQIPPTKEINNSSPKILSPENVNRYEQIFQSPTWRNIKSCRNNQPNLIDDPFFDSKKSGGIPRKLTIIILISSNKAKIFKLKRKMKHKFRPKVSTLSK